jgi:adenosylmethionine-8-amino-7-oxononanoate aminotransferase
LKSDNIAERVRQAAVAEGVLTYPTQGCVDGHRGDHLLLAPPFTISEQECKLVENALSSALKKLLPS